jgi:hypothetical protein
MAGGAAEILEDVRRVESSISIHHHGH